MADELHNDDTTQPLIQYHSHFDLLNQLGILYTAHPVVKRPYRVVKTTRQITQLGGMVRSAS